MVLQIIERERERETERERDLFQEQLNRLLDKEKNLVSTCNSLDDAFVNLVGDAEKQPQEIFVLVTKANALKRRQNVLKMEVNELQKKMAEIR